MGHTKEILARSRPVSFLYDRSDREFIVGGNKLPLDVVGEYGLRHQYGKESLSSAEVDSMIDTLPLVHTYSMPVALPKFSKFIIEEWSSDLEREVIEVMAEVMPASQDLLEPSLDHLGFGADRVDHKLGRAILKVPGICACIGPDATVLGGWGEKTWRDQVMAYTAHNVDRSIQRSALLAGLGHIATLAR